MIRCDICGRVQKRDVTSSRRRLCTDCGIAKATATALAQHAAAVARQAASEAAKHPSN